MTTIKKNHFTRSSKEMKEGYKKTKLGWIPEEWEVVRFEEIADFNPKSDELPDRFAYIDLESVKDGVLQKRNVIEKINAPSRAQRLLKKNDVLFQTVRPYQKNNLFFDEEGNDFVASSGYAQIRSKHSSQFIFHLIQATYFNNQVLARCTGTSFPAISSTDLSKVLIKLPTLAEREKIATILTTWDRAIAKQEQLIAAKQHYKKGLMQLLLTGKLRFEGFEGEWERVKLSDVSIFRNGKGHEKSISMDGDFVVVNSKFISTDGEVRKFTNDQFSPLNKDDIVMVMSDVPNGRALAKCYIIEEDGKYSLNQRICSLKPKKMNVNFLKNQLNRNKYYLKFNDGISQTNLKKKEVLNCPILKPELKEQQKIASVLSTADSEITLLESELEQLKGQKRGLMQRLLTGEVRVKN